MRKNVMEMLAGMLIGGGMMALAYYFTPEQTLEKIIPSNRTELMIFFSALPIAPLAAIAMHELGHLLAGLSVGFQFQLFVVGLLGVKNEQGKIKWYLNRNFAFMGGVAATSPRTIDPSNKGKFAFVLLAGPLMSVIFGMVCFLVFSLGDSMLNAVWALTGITSFSIFLATTLPHRSGTFFTDRKRFQRLMGGGLTGDIEMAQLEMAVRIFADGSCKNIDLEKARLIQKDNDTMVRFFGLYYEFQYFKDNLQTNEEQAARQTLLDSKGIVPAQVWKMLGIDD